MSNKYDFYDLEKVEELAGRPETIEIDGYYWDPTDLPPKEYLDEQVPLQFKNIGKWMRSKMNGLQTRETMARLAEMVGINTHKAVDVAERTQLRQDAVEDFNTQVVQEMTDKDVISAPELIESRNGESRLHIRLNRDKLDIVAKMQETAINVTQAPYSASPTKTAAENTLAIQQALDDYPSVLIPEGEFLHTTLTLGNDNHLMGVGHKSILKNVGSTASIQIASADAISNTRVSHLGITSTKTSPGQHGIEYVGFNAAYSTVSHNRLYGLGGHGIYGGHEGHVNNVEISSNTIRNNTGDGFNMQYTIGQINGIYIHDNDVSWNENGIKFFGNNIVIENNTVQANRRYAFSLSDVNLSSLDSGELSKLCYGSTIRKNYTEQNGYAETENASVIGIFTCYESDANLNKVLRNLDISSNYFGEVGTKYKSLIHLVDLKTSHTSSRSCVFQTQNNFSHLPLLTYNKPSAISEGTMIDESVGLMMPDAMVDNLPAYVEVRGLKRKNALEWKTEIAEGVAIGGTRTINTKGKINEVMIVTNQSFIIFNRAIQNLFPGVGLDGTITAPGVGTINVNCQIVSDNFVTIQVKTGSSGGVTRIFYR